MTTYYGSDGRPFTPPEPVARAHRALSIAADRIGRNGWDAALRAHRGRGLPRYVPSVAHRDVVAAMPRVLSGDMPPDAAMALLHRWDVLAERMGARIGTSAALPRSLTCRYSCRTR